MEFLKIVKPEIKKEELEKAVDLMFSPDKPGELLNYIKRICEPHYLSWEEAKHKQPLPANLTVEQAWAAVLVSRHLRKEATPIQAENGKRFRMVKLTTFEKLCHEFDLHLGGELLASVEDMDTGTKRQLVSRGLMEEAIASAQLEGADTTRAYAQKMLLENIKPRNESDQMIINNHVALQTIEGRLKNEKMSRNLLTEIHGLLSNNTKDSWGVTPHWRDNDEPLYVQDALSGTIYHQAPSVTFVTKQIDALIDFANDGDKEHYLHPILKAALLHFWIGYLHPFTDGNGRTARAVFHWYLLSHGYWAFAYLPLSAKLKSGGKKAYTMAYVNSEQDDHDVTYFLSYLLGKIEETRHSFTEYVEKMRKETVQISQAAKEQFALSERQVRLLKHLGSGGETSPTSYAKLNDVSRITAGKDLSALMGHGLLKRQKIGLHVRYTASDKLRNWLSKLDDARP